MEDTTLQNTARVAKTAAVGGAGYAGYKVGKRAGDNVSARTSYGRKNLVKQNQKLARAYRAEAAASEMRKSPTYKKSRLRPGRKVKVDTSWTKEPTATNTYHAEKAVQKASAKHLRPQRLGKFGGAALGAGGTAYGIHKLHNAIHPNTSSRASSSGRYLEG